MPKPKRHNNWLYRSGLEDKVAEQLTAAGREFKYEQDKISYTVPEKIHTYTPDFTIVSDSGKVIYIETKGIWDSDDRYKHLLIRLQHPELDIRFVFQNSKAKIRKGSKTTYEDICNGLGRAPFKNICWKYSNKTIPTTWMEE